MHYLDCGTDSWVYSYVKNTKFREFPGGLVVRIPGSHCCGPDSIPGRVTKILQAVRHAKKKKNQIYILNMRSLLCVNLGSIKLK